MALKNLWISTVNPLRGLTMSRVVQELEQGQRGDYAMLQWLYHFIEKRDATLRGAKRRIRSSLLKLDWDVKIQAGLPAALQAEAGKQQAALKAEYEKITNLRKALGHLALAEFRGYSHLEKHFDDGGSVVKLEPVPQWHWCRMGMYGDWKFQENAVMGGLEGTTIDPADFVIREVEDPINEIALICFCRKGLSQKDFDAFIARYGIPFVFWILSESMAAALASDPAKMNEWMGLMRGIGSDGEGILPGGELKTLEHAGHGGKEQNPFLTHLGYQDEQIVMAATSGKLTMLNDAGGLGSGNSDVHSDTFDEIALALAMEVSETLQEQMDSPALDRLFPGARHLVYFELAAKDAADVSAVCTDAKTLGDAGYDVDPAQISEMTGYRVSRREALAPVPGKPPGVPVPVPALSKNRDATPAADIPAPDDKSVRVAAASLLGGFGDLAKAFLDTPDGPDLEQLLADAATSDPADPTTKDK